MNLTSADEDVARTRQLGIQVPVAGYDEVGRLGRAFDRMLPPRPVRGGPATPGPGRQPRAAYAADLAAYEHLTARRIDELSPATRDELVADLTQEARELTDLVNELVDLAEIAEEVAGLARRRTARQVVIRTVGDTTIDGRPGLLQRAVSHLVENAAKFDRDGTAPIEINIIGPARPGPVRVEVLDRGPGIAAGDLIRVFDRFYRAADARSLPGSGLGLSIVREVALSHGGAPFVEARLARRVKWHAPQLLDARPVKIHTV